MKNNIKRFQQFINEDFSASEYDRILDLYNEHGEQGLTPEELEYLKSGGKSEIPSETPDWKRDLRNYVNTNQPKEKRADADRPEKETDLAEDTRAVINFISSIMQLLDLGTINKAMAFAMFLPLTGSDGAGNRNTAMNNKFKKITSKNNSNISSEDAAIMKKFNNILSDDKGLF